MILGYGVYGVDIHISWLAGFALVRVQCWHVYSSEASTAQAGGMLENEQERFNALPEESLAFGIFIPSW